MTGLLICLVVVLATMTVACLIFSMVLIWWTRDSAGQHSISAAKGQQQAAEMMLRAQAQSERTVEHSTELVRLQTSLTETLLLGRPMPPTSPPVELEETSATLPTPDDLWSGLPQSAREAIVRDRAEAGVWPDPSETLHPVSPNGSDPPVEAMSTWVELGLPPE